MNLQKLCQLFLWSEKAPEKYNYFKAEFVFTIHPQVRGNQDCKSRGRKQWVLSPGIIVANMKNKTVSHGITPGPTAQGFGARQNICLCQ